MQKKHLIGAIAGIFLAGIQAWAQYDITLAPGSVSSQYADSPPSEDASKLFDHNELTKYFTFHSTSWITFKANNQYVVSSYTLISGNDYPERDPSSWKLEGSNDGSSWSSIDSRSGQSFSGRLQKKAFASSNTTAYQYYKLSISTSFTEIQLADLTLFAQLDHDVAVTNISLSSKSLQTSSIPTVLISNNGLSTENFKVTCVIDSSGKQVYNKTADVKDLAKSQSAKISLPSFPFLCSTYKIHAFTTLSTDSTPYNDTLEYHLSTTGYNLATDKVVYEVAGVHLDDMWLWTYDDVIREYLPNTLTENFKLLNTYPEYEFSWEGAFRYNMIKQHFPARYDTLKSWIAKDRWHYVGTFWDACDVNMPSAEALIRQSLYGTEFSMDEFGKRSFDIYLPDCFGFGYVLPTIARHCGIIGFSTQKFDRWGGYFPSPFSVGRWIGPDGSEIIAALKPGDYFGTGMDIRTADGDETKAKSGVWLTYDYIGMGDRGGSPREEDVSAMCGRIKQNSSNDIKVVCKASDQLYRDLSPAQFAALPSYEGELLMKMHGVGCYTSWASMKLKNRKNEQLAMAAEFSNVSAHWLSGGSFTYPMDNISNAWKRFLACQFHDVLTGTSNTNVYDIAQSMEDSSVADFTNAFLSGNNAVAANTKQPLTTTVSKAGRIPVVVANPLAFDRVDIAEVSVTPFTGSGVKVFDTKGNEVASQIIGTTGNAATIAFVAHAPSAGYAVYEVEQSDKANDVAGSLSIKSGGGIDTLENGFYRVVVNKNGDIASVYHKASSKELLAAPSRLEMRPDPSVQEYPAWEITCDAVSASPTAYVDESVQKTIVEQGPARVCLKVVHSKNGSTFTHYIRLGADSAGMRVDVANEVDWRTTGTLLKVGFPMTCANDKATWDLGIGTIMRGVMTSDLYEVPGQQWADQTASDGSYGMSILNDCKYGWNKESNAKLNLTLIHSPADPRTFQYPCDQSNVKWVGIHEFTYSLYGHTGNWTSGTVQQAACVNQPFTAFQSIPREGSFSSKEISFVKTNSPQVMVMAVKKAQKSDYYVVRVREAAGSATSNAKLTFGGTITEAIEMNGVEEILTETDLIVTSGKELSFKLTKYQPRTFAVKIARPDAGTAMIGKNTIQKPTPLPTVAIQLTFGNRARFSIAIPALDKVLQVSIYNCAGRAVRTLVKNGAFYSWDGKAGEGGMLAKGVYAVCVKTDKSRYVQSVVIAK